MKKNSLLVVAHPDDETIFFGGLLQVHRRRPWKVICVTDGNADGLGEKRRGDFARACAKFKIKSYEMWDFPDRFEHRLDVLKLAERLSHENAVEVFTHGPLGEYGHPHHQDVCLAVHRAFEKRANVWSVAHNMYAEKIFRIPRKAYNVKCEVLEGIYFDQTRRFARLLPAQSHEGFAQIGLAEIETLHAFFISGTPPNKKDLKAYAWFEPYLSEFRTQILQRPF